MCFVLIFKDSSGVFHITRRETSVFNFQGANSRDFVFLYCTFIIPYSVPFVKHFLYFL
nr:MAG TPA: hypothetical protein [Caudoviricetes sp.]